MSFPSYKKIDEAGRIVLSKDIRKEMDLEVYETLKIQVEKGKIIITKAEPCCTFCRSTSDLIEYKEKTICKKCLDEITKLS